MFRRIALVALACFAFASTPAPAAAAPPSGASTAEKRNGSCRISDHGATGWRSHVAIEHAKLNGHALHVVHESRAGYSGPFDAPGYRTAVSKLDTVAEGRLVVTVFGSANASADSPVAENRRLYALMKQGCAALPKPDPNRQVEIFRRGAVVQQGGGPGIMAAAHEGARSRDPDAVFTTVLNMGAKQRNGSFDTRRSHTFEDINARQLVLQLGDAYLFGNPGDGTKMEYYQGKTTIRTDNMVPKPMVLVDAPADGRTRQWHGELRESALRGIHRQAVEATGLEMWTVATTPKQIVEQVFGFYRHYAGTCLDGNQRILFTHPHLKNKLTRGHLDHLKESVENRHLKLVLGLERDTISKLELTHEESRILSMALGSEHQAIKSLLKQAELHQPPGEVGPSLVFPDSDAKNSYLYPIIHELNALDL